MTPQDDRNLDQWLKEQPEETRLYILRYQMNNFFDAKMANRMVGWLLNAGFVEQKLAIFGYLNLMDDIDLAIQIVSDPEILKSLRRVRLAIATNSSRVTLLCSEEKRRLMAISYSNFFSSEDM